MIPKSSKIVKYIEWIVILALFILFIIWITKTEKITENNLSLSTTNNDKEYNITNLLY